MADKKRRNGNQYERVPGSMEVEETGMKIENTRKPLPDAVTHKEPHSESPFGPLISPLVYGGMDGVVSVFVGVLIAVVTREPLKVVVSLTLAKLFAGAFSMGLGQLIASWAEVDYAKGERKREAWECRNFKEGEIEEMVELYIAKGYTEETSRKIVNILAKDDELFVNAMMIEELEISPDKEDQQPVKLGFTSFFSFLAFGTVPVIPYIVWIIGFVVAGCSDANACVGTVWTSATLPLYISIGLTVIGVLILGLLKAKVTGIKYWISLSQAFGGAILSVGFGAGLAYAIYYATGETA